MLERRRWNPLNQDVVKLRFLVLLGALVAVGYGIYVLQSPSFRTALQSFFGAPTAPIAAPEAVMTAAQDWNWCPKNPTQLVFEKGSTPVKDAAVVRELCFVRMEKVDAAALQQAQWQTILRAKDANGLRVSLDADLEKGIFRTSGLPFKDERLRQAVLKYSQP